VQVILRRFRRTSVGTVSPLGKIRFSLPALFSQLLRFHFVVNERDTIGGHVFNNMRQERKKKVPNANGHPSMQNSVGTHSARTPQSQQYHLQGDLMDMDHIFDNPSPLPPSALNGFASQRMPYQMSLQSNGQNNPPAASYMQQLQTQSHTPTRSPLGHGAGQNQSTRQGSGNMAGMQLSQPSAMQRLNGMEVEVSPLYDDF
jgi:hypothetical protein